MSFATLYGFEGNPRTRAVQVVANYEGLKLDLVVTNPFLEGGAPASYKAKFPLGLIPGLEKEGYLLSESVAIITYLAGQSNKAGLLGTTKEDAAKIQQWLLWTNFTYMPSQAALVSILNGKVQYTKPGAEAAKVKLLAGAKYLNDYLADKTFLVGERVSAADVFLGSALLRGTETVVDDAFRADYVNVTRYLNTVIRQPHFLSVIGTVPKFIEKAIVYTPPKKEAKKEAPAAPKPKEAPKPKAVEKDDAEEDEAPKEVKAKHPAEALGAPKSFPLDEFKRQYSNNDTPVAFKWLEEHFDPQEYSLWKVTFKYPEELTQVFMSTNQITGFHNRLEGSRKYLFGSAGVYGVANNSKITGAYMVRGSDFKQIFDVAPDFESYEYTPLDIKADKDFILGCWAWTNEYEGLPYADGKVFK